MDPETTNHGQTPEDEKATIGFSLLLKSVEDRYPGWRFLQSPGSLILVLLYRGGFHFEVSYNFMVKLADQPKTAEAIADAVAASIRQGGTGWHTIDLTRQGGTTVVARVLSYQEAAKVHPSWDKEPLASELEQLQDIVEEAAGGSEGPNEEGLG